MPRITLVLILLISLFLCSSCSERDDKSAKERLSKWDSMLDTTPQRVSDSLEAMDRNGLSRSGKAY